VADKSEQLSSVFVLRIACCVPGGHTVYKCITCSLKCVFVLQLTVMRQCML